ncbi:MAG: hypothetical protein KAS99_01165 [Candidatus Omnitrophica bacterium]|nr:hypothetical protein [Candidatus Omnitrophota bacterium]
MYRISFYRDFSIVAHYYHVAPTHLEELRRNSYGCKEAAESLSQIPDIKNCQIVLQSRMMPVNVYLDLFAQSQDNRMYRKTQTKSKINPAYYLIWAPESWPEDYWGGEFSWLWKYFKAKYPDATAIKTIYYPNGLAAIHIFKIEGDAER